MVPCVRLCYGLTGTKHHRRRRATQPDFHAGRASPQGHSRLCCIWSTGGMPMPLLAEGLDRQSQLLERGDNSKACWLLDCQLVVAAAKVLDEGVSGDHDPGAVLLFEPAHRPEPRLQPAVVAFDAVVGVLVGPMPRRRQQVIEHCRIRPCGRW